MHTKLHNSVCIFRLKASVLFWELKKTAGQAEVGKAKLFVNSFRNAESDIGLISYATWATFS